MAPTIVPDTVTASPAGGSGDVKDSTLATSYAGVTTALPQWPVNCSTILEHATSAINITTHGVPHNHTEAYRLCIQHQALSHGVNNSSGILLGNMNEQILNSKNGSGQGLPTEAFFEIASTLAAGSAGNVPAPTPFSVISDWIEVLATRKDLLRISIQSTILIAIFLASVLANSFVFVVFCRKPNLLSNSYRFVLNLAVCNCLMTVLVMPFVLISTFTHEWILGWGSCEAIGMLAILLFVASILTLMLIAMDRYHAIMKPLHYHLTVICKRPGLCIAGVWLVSLLIAIPPLLGWNHFSFQPGKAMCTVTWRSANPADRAYSFSFVLLCFVVPYFVMLWVYVCAFRTAQRTTARARRNSVTPEHAASQSTTGGISNGDLQGITQKMLNRDRRRSSAASLIHNTTRRRSSSSITRALLSLHRDDWKAAKTSLIVMSAFTVCWLPFFILITMDAILGPSLAEYGWAGQEEGWIPSGLVIPYWLEGSAICLALAGCALNPLVYVFRSEKIKYEIRKLFCPGRSHQNGANHRDREKEAASTTTAASMFRSSVLASSRRDSPASFAGSCTVASTMSQVASSARLSSCSSSASLANPAIHQAARITGAAATMVVTFNEDAKHRDGVCL